MTTTKIACLIPSTSNGRDWKQLTDTYLYKHTMKSYFHTYNKGYLTRFYIGIDRNDPIYDNEENKKGFERLCSVIQNISIEFVYMDNVKKGHLTVMWNILFEKALQDGYDYFVQCGDDIEFHSKGWLSDAITILKNSNNIGVAGPLNNNPRILTQSIVSRKHYDLFGYYFPPEIKNWFCDDWINLVYRELKFFYPMKQHFCANIGGQPRYVINDGASNQSVHQLCLQIVKKDVVKATHYLQQANTNQVSITNSPSTLS